MEASIEDRLDRHDIDLLLDVNRHDEELTRSIPGGSHDLQHESHATDVESNDGLCNMDSVELHTELTPLHDLDPRSRDQTDGGDIVFTDVEDKVASASKHQLINKENQGTCTCMYCVYEYVLNVLKFLSIVTLNCGFLSCTDLSAIDWLFFCFRGHRWIYGWAGGGSKEGNSRAA